MAATLERDYSSSASYASSIRATKTPTDIDWQAYHQQLQTLDHHIDTDQVSLEQRLSYLLSLRERVSQWKDQQPEHPLFDTQLSLISCVAYKLCDWPLLIFIHQQWPKHSIEYARTIAYVWQQMNAPYKAIDVLTSQLLLYPEQQDINEQRQSIVADTHLPELTDQELSLALLQPHHMESFSWQYSQTVIEQCNLQDFSDQIDWKAWYRMMSEDRHRVIFAIIHQEWGFIGCVNLQVYDGAGFFYYWLGDDFQGCGFGPRAVNLLLHYGYHHMSMDCCYAKVFDYNEASHKAIAKIGFTPLACKARAPFDNEVFYYLGPERPSYQYYQDLSFLLNMMDSPIELYPEKLQLA